jgi:integrase
MGLYTLLPPRRVSDVGSLVYGSSESANAKPGPNFVSEDYSTVVYADYKTAKTYGVVEIAIPAKLQELLQALELKAGDKVFSDVKNFSRHVSKVFSSVSGSSKLDPHITANALRHSFVSHFLSKPRSTEERKTAGRLMGHSSAMQQQYLRLELTSSFDHLVKLA